MVLLDSRRDAMQSAEAVSRDLATVAERDIQRNLQIIDLSLTAMVSGAEDSDVMRLPPKRRNAILFDQALTAKYVGEVLILDADGNVTADSGHLLPRIQNYADRDYFRVQRANPDMGLVISRPVVSRLTHNNSQFVALSRRINRADGSFGGIALITLNVDYFRNLFADLDIGPHGAVALFDKDGATILRLPLRDGLSPVTSGANFGWLASSEAGAFVGRSSSDGEMRLFVHNKIEPFSLVLVIATAERDIYAAWHRRAVAMGGAIVLLAVGYLLLAQLLASELKRRAKVEAELRTLSHVDALTTLANRRHFDEVLETEWNRALREKSRLSVLFVDVDYFKQFNDRYGHERGDNALRSVALALKQSVKRPADLVARYGGEEFALVLPDTDAAGALAIAHRVLTSVEALQIFNEASEHKVVSVSIGTATTGGDREHSSPTALLTAADAALYRAKRNGRNRIESMKHARLSSVA